MDENEVAPQVDLVGARNAFGDWPDHISGGGAFHPGPITLKGPLDLLIGPKILGLEYGDPIRRKYRELKKWSSKNAIVWERGTLTIGAEKYRSLKLVDDQLVRTDGSDLLDEDAIVWIDGELWAGNQRGKDLLADCEVFRICLDEAIERQSELAAAQPAPAPTVDVWPPREGWGFRNGQVSFRGVVREISGKPAAVLQMVVKSQKLAGVQGKDIHVKIWDDDFTSIGVVRTNLSEARKVVEGIRKALGMSNADPIPPQRDVGWRLIEDMHGPVHVQ